MQQTASQQPKGQPALGLRLPPSALPRPAAGAAPARGPWHVVQRANGFHVSREAGGAGKTEALTNEVGKTKVFRSINAASMAATKANFATAAQRLSAEPLLAPAAGQRGFITIDHALATFIGVCLIMLALSWLGPALDATSGPSHAGYGYTAPTTSVRLAASAGREADIALCQRLHGENASAIHLPDGQHRCTDKRGRRLSTRSGIAAHPEH